MPRRSLRLAITLTATGALLTLASGCDRLSESRPARAGTATGPASARVETVSPARKTLNRVTEQPGQVEAFETTPIFARVPGYVGKVFVDIGDRVEAGDLLARLDVPDLDAELDQKGAVIERAKAERTQAEAAVKVAEASVASARARVAAARAGTVRAEADLTRWRAEHRRIEQLFREKAMTGTLVDETKSKLESAEAACAEVEAEVQSAQATLHESQAKQEKAKADLHAAEAQIEVARLDRARIGAQKAFAALVAPFAGTITQRHVDPGHLIQPGPGSTPLFVIDRSDLVTVSVAVPELFATSVRPGQYVVVRLQSVPNRTFGGTVTRTSYALDPATRTLAIEIDLPNPDGSLRPGSFAHAGITLDVHPKALALPTTAILRDGDQASCVRVVNRRAERRSITTGIVDGDNTEILSGLDEHDLVVRANSASLVNGQAVEPVTTLAIP
jgi:HlyD family secretion protein